MSNIALSTKEAQSINAHLEDTFESYKLEGFTRKTAMVMLKPVKNILRKWDEKKDKDNQKDLRLTYRAAHTVINLWWTYCRHNINLEAECLWNLAVLLPGEEQKEKKAVTVKQGKAGAKEETLDLSSLTLADLNKMLAAKKAEKKKGRK